MTDKGIQDTQSDFQEGIEHSSPAINKAFMYVFLKSTYYHDISRSDMILNVPYIILALGAKYESPYKIRITQGDTMTQWSRRGRYIFLLLKNSKCYFLLNFCMLFVTYFYAKTQRYSILRSSEYVEPLMICMACTLFY